MFKSIYGNEDAKKRLSFALERKTLGNSLLFQGPDGVGKILFAECAARYLVAKDPFYPHDHPDIRCYRPEGKSGMHSIDAIRNFCEAVYMAPYQSEKKVFILTQADRMLPYSANALLKTLEEPPVDTFIFLLTDQPERLLPTIRSRLWKLSFRPLADEEIAAYLRERKGIEQEQAMAWAQLARGSLSRALAFLAEDQDTIRAELTAILRQMSFPSYAELKNVCELLGKEFASQKVRLQQQFLDDSMAQLSSAEDLSAANKEQLQKQMEGSASLQQALLFDYIFEQVLFWWRDLALLKMGVQEELVYHKAHLDKLKQFAFKPFASLSRVEQSILQAKLALERGIPPASVLETLFLNLEMIRA